MTTIIRMKRFRSTYVTPQRYRRLVVLRFIAVWRNRLNAIDNAIIDVLGLDGIKRIALMLAFATLILGIIGIVA